MTYQIAPIRSVSVHWCYSRNNFTLIKILIAGKFSVELSLTTMTLFVLKINSGSQHRSNSGGNQSIIPQNFLKPKKSFLYHIPINRCRSKISDNKNKTLIFSKSRDKLENSVKSTGHFLIKYIFIFVSHRPRVSN